MTFVTASLAIAGLAATAVPILIHLLWRRRRVPIEWAAMRFLVEAYRRHRRRLRLEQVLLLLVRCLIPALLGLALARPLLDRAPLPGADLSRTVYLIIDDGMASGLTIYGAATPLDQHIGAAKRIIRGLSAGDRAGVITAATPASVLLSPPSADHRAVIELLDSLEPNASRTDLAGALEHLRQALSHRQDQDERAIVYLLSGFRAGSADLDDPLPMLAGDAGATVDLLACPPAADPISNVQISGIEPARSVLLADVPEESGRVTVHLARHGGELEQGVSRVRLSMDASAGGAEKIVQWAAGQVEAGVEFLLGEFERVQGETAITAGIEDDPLAADNQYHLVLPICRRFEIVLVDRREFGYEPSLDRLTAGQWIRRALEPGAAGPLTITDAEPASLSAADVQTADAVALPRPDLVADAGWATLRRFVDDGGLLLITPPDEEILHGWVDRLESDLALPWSLRREVRQHAEGLTLAEDPPRVELLRQIWADLPDLMQPVLVYRLLPVGDDVAGVARGEAALRLSDGSPLILVGSPEAEMEQAVGEVRPSPGLVVLFTTAPELGWTNLPTKPLMVPLFQEIVRQGLSLIRSSGPTRVGDITALAAAVSEPAAETLVSPGGTSIGIQRSGRLARALSESGLYRVVDVGGRDIGRVAVNVDPAGGDLTPQGAGAVKAWLDHSGSWRWLDPDEVTSEVVGPGGRSSPAGLLLLFLLAMVVLETLMARSFSRGSKAARGPEADGLRPTMDERSSLTSAGEPP